MYRRVWPWALFVAAASFAAFLPALDNGWVKWDDDKFFLDHSLWRGLSWEHLRWMFTSAHSRVYQPLSWVSLAVDHRFWGLDPRGYHLTNLVLHALAAAVFFLVCRRLLAGEGEDRRRAAAAAFAALFFALHPLRVESVAWATERRDVLSGLFYMLTLHWYLAGRRAASLAAFALSLLSKGIGMSLPATLLALDVYPHGRPFKESLKDKLPYFALALAGFALTAWGQSGGDKAIPLSEFSLLQRAAQAAYGLAFYARKTILPFGLSPLYELPARFEPWTRANLASAAAVLGVLALLLRRRREWPWGLPAAAHYAAALVPVLGLLSYQYGPQLVADRYSYLSCLCLATLAGGAALSALRAAPRAAPAALAGTILFLGALTWRQTKVWRDSETLWARVLSIEPDNAIAHNNLGRLLAEAGKLEEAAQRFERALRLNPRLEGARYNLGLVAASRGSWAEAAARYAEEAALYPRGADLHNNWAIALAALGRPEEARARYEEAIRLRPGHAAARHNLGVLLAGLGRREEAIASFEAALRAAPGYAACRNNLGLAYAAGGRLEEAAAQFAEAVRLAPGFAEAHNNWGVVLTRRGLYKEAAFHFREALKHAPGFTPARSNLERLGARGGA